VKGKSSGNFDVELGLSHYFYPKFGAKVRGFWIQKSNLTIVIFSYQNPPLCPKSIRFDKLKPCNHVPQHFNSSTFQLNTMIGIIMGSDSDLPVMRQAAEVLQSFDIPFEISVVSAHRTPEHMIEYAKSAHQRGLKVIIAGAGGAAHLPGMVASVTPLPVIGVPVKSSNSIDGWDSILSILQMPNGVPVATVALNAAKNAGLLAAQIMGSHDATILEKMQAYKQKMAEEVLEKAKKLEEKGFEEYGK
jgi:5-(carboxyamino)imidazole ribonucleotide mutase